MRTGRIITCLVVIGASTALAGSAAAAPAAATTDAHAHACVLRVQVGGRDYLPRATRVDAAVLTRSAVVTGQVPPCDDTPLDAAGDPVPQAAPPVRTVRLRGVRGVSTRIAVAWRASPTAPFTILVRPGVCAGIGPLARQLGCLRRYTQRMAAPRGGPVRRANICIGTVQADGRVYEQRRLISKGLVDARRIIRGVSPPCNDTLRPTVELATPVRLHPLAGVSTTLALVHRERVGSRTVYVLFVRRNVCARTPTPARELACLRWRSRLPVTG